MPTDFRAGLLVFALLEIGTYLMLLRAEGSWFGRPNMEAWQSGFVAATVPILGGLVLLWRAGSRGTRPGRIMIFSILWLVVLTVRLVPLFMVGGSSVPVLLTLFAGQLTFALIVPAVADERRKAAATGT